MPAAESLIRITVSITRLTVTTHIQEKWVEHLVAEIEHEDKWAAIRHTKFDAHADIPHEVTVIKGRRFPTISSLTAGDPSGRRVLRDRKLRCASANRLSIATLSAPSPVRLMKVI